MDRIDGALIEYRTSTAEEFWDILSPQKHLFGSHNKTIFRGQASDAWELEPAILRTANTHPVYAFLPFRSKPDHSENRIFAEIYALRIFAEYCDSAGLRIPSDSQEFRRSFLDPTTKLDGFIFHRQIWPSREYFEIMALAQHYALPTRLLDWTRSSYVAAYFAASGALNDEVSGRLSIWALNIQNIKPRLEDVEIIPIPGSNNPNIAAQDGLFTLLRQKYARGAPFEGTHCLNRYVQSHEREALRKITLPLQEAPKIIDLCERYGVTGATLYPDFYGAARATRDSLKCWGKSEWTDNRDIRAQTLPAVGPTR
jgi:hypothetical protein